MNTLPAAPNPLPTNGPQTAGLHIQPMGLHHAPLLHALYLATPNYFRVLGSQVPSLQEVTRDVEAALFDPRRRLELLYWGQELIGSLDYKLEFPHAGDVTINLLLIRADWQSKGIGRLCVQGLEARLTGSRGNGSGARRLLASVLGDHPQVVEFWQKQGFEFATDARPVMTWYAKALRGGG